MDASSAADWFVESDADWWTKVCLGPPGFEAYARVHYDLDDEAPADSDDMVRRHLREVLAGHLPVAKECFLGVWDGNPDGERWHAGPKISVHTIAGQTGHYAAARTYHLFSGTLLEAHEADDGHGLALTWPADHAWFVAGDVDPDWIGVGGTQALIDQILASPALDAAPSAYDASDWEVR